MSEIRRWVALSVVLYCMTLHAGIAFGARANGIATPAVFVTTQPRFVLTPAGFGAVEPGQVLSLRPDVLRVIRRAAQVNHLDLAVTIDREHADLVLIVDFPPLPSRGRYIWTLVDAKSGTILEQDQNQARCECEGIRGVTQGDADSAYHL